MKITLRQTPTDPVNLAPLEIVKCGAFPSGVDVQYTLGAYHNTVVCVQPNGLGHYDWITSDGARSFNGLTVHKDG